LIVALLAILRIRKNAIRENAVRKKAERLRGLPTCDIEAELKSARPIRCLSNSNSSSLEKGVSTMRSIAIINQKGGVGKTTTAVNLSAALAEAGNRVWLIDLDPQSHASLHLGFGTEDGYLSMYDVLTDDVGLDEVRHEVQSNLWLTPSHIDLAAAEMELSGAVGREIILRDKMSEVQADFDYIIFDCPPSLGVLTLNGLTTAHEVFLPLQPHFLALHGLSKLLRTIELVARRLNSRLQLSSVVYCLYDAGTRLCNEVVSDVEEFFEVQRKTNHLWSDAISFDTRIRRNIRLAEAPSYGQSIFQYAPESHGAQDYRSLAAEVMRQTENMLGRVSTFGDNANSVANTIIVNRSA
jgi:chromosome partitioning protein